MDFLFYLYYRGVNCADEIEIVVGDPEAEEAAPAEERRRFIFGEKLRDLAAPAPYILRKFPGRRNRYRYRLRGKSYRERMRFRKEFGDGFFGGME